MVRGKAVRVGWVEDLFADDIKKHLLYGDAERLVSELANGDTLEAEVAMNAVDGSPFLFLCYRHKGENLTDANCGLDWFPEDEELLNTIHEVYMEGRGCI